MKIKRVEVNEENIREFVLESEFVGLNVSLLKEVGSWAGIAVSAYRNGEMKWSKDEAIICGHMVRLFKLIHAVLDQTCQHRCELSMVFSRLVFECVINLRFMIKHASPELFQSYRLYSLKHEAKLYQQIRQNMSHREGEKTAIEERMLESVNRMFDESGVTQKEAIKCKNMDWGKKNFTEKCKDLELQDAHLLMFSGGSNIIHGNLQDLMEYHLEHLDGNTYRAHPDWNEPRPQLLTATSLLCCDAISDYLKFVNEQKTKEIVENIDDLKKRLFKFLDLHEDFLKK